MCNELRMNSWMDGENKHKKILILNNLIEMFCLFIFYRLIRHGFVVTFAALVLYLHILHLFHYYYYYCYFTALWVCEEANCCCPSLPFICQWKDSGRTYNFKWTSLMVLWLHWELLAHVYIWHSIVRIPYRAT